ncbi:Uma2 family endonuclease [Micromonospora sp. NPDC005367]|uniref:Uma2 family endonuclease n=1 Tax=Micromonospora sp. NPDC005367 TaxID=3155590 RepID=UPI0033AEBEFE
MTVAVFDHEGPWTEEEYLSLGETSQRVELFDGSLHDKVLKMHHYAAAGIDWYLLADQAAGALRLHRRRGRHYVEHSAAKRGETLELTEPVRATIRPEELLP